VGQVILSPAFLASRPFMPLWRGLQPAASASAGVPDFFVACHFVSPVLVAQVISSHVLVGQVILSPAIL